jgi:aminoglycoside 3-N-acetyltransferase
MKPKDYISYRTIASEMGIRPGEVVLLTSDILKLAMKARKAEKEFSADDFIDSFTALLGNEGTLLIPAYNFDLERGDAYNPSLSPPMTGALAVAAMKRKDFIRTANPLHSFLVWGKDAEMLAGMENVSSFGTNSPFAYLMQKNALMVFAGTTIAEAMTFTHFVEESEKVRYRKYKEIKINYTVRKRITEERSYKLYAKKPGWTMMLQRLREIIPADKLNVFRFNDIEFSSIRCADAYEIISKDIKENKAASIAAFDRSLFFRDIIKQQLERFNIFRTAHGKIRSGKRIR